MLGRKKALLNSGAQSDSGPRILHKSLGSVHSFTDLWCMMSEFWCKSSTQMDASSVHPVIFSLRNPNLAQHMEDSVEKIFGVASAHGVVRQWPRPSTWQLATTTTFQTTSSLDPQRPKQSVMPKPKHELWVMALLALHASSHCFHPELGSEGS